MRFLYSALFFIVLLRYNATGDESLSLNVDIERDKRCIVTLRGQKLALSDPEQLENRLVGKFAEPRLVKIQIILSSDVSLGAIFEMRALLHKIGFIEIELFVKSKDGNRMVKVEVTAGNVPIAVPAVRQK
jgi:hypothetical protein